MYRRKEGRKKQQNQNYLFFVRERQIFVPGFLFLLSAYVFLISCRLFCQKPEMKFSTLRFVLFYFFFNVSFSTIRIKMYAVRGEVEQRTVREREGWPLLRCVG